MIWASDVHQPHFCLVSPSCLSVPFSPLSFHLHFSFVGRNSRLFAHTIARLLAYESSRGAVSEAGKRERRRVIKKSVLSRTLIRLMLALLPTVCGTFFFFFFYLIAKRTELDCSSSPLVFWFYTFSVNDNRQACLFKPLVSTQDVQILMMTLTLLLINL